VTSCLDGDLGAIRNWILLDTIGCKVVMVDDDVLADVSPAPAQDHYVAVKGGTDPRHYWLEQSPESAILARDTDIKNSLVLAVVEHLGKKVRDLPGRMLGTYQSGTIRAVQVGVVGEMPGTDWLGAPVYQSVRPVSEVPQGAGFTRSASSLVAHEISSLATFVLGLDNCEGLAPFYPQETKVGGPFGESGYGAALATVRGSWTVYLPLEAVHRPSIGKTKSKTASVNASCALARAHLREDRDYEKILTSTAHGLSDELRARESQILADLPSDLRDSVKTLLEELSIIPGSPGPDKENYSKYQDILSAWPEVIEKTKLLQRRRQFITVTL
jgi:hypothetical protein